MAKANRKANKANEAKTVAAILRSDTDRLSVSLRLDFDGAWTFGEAMAKAHLITAEIYARGMHDGFAINGPYERDSYGMHISLGITMETSGRSTAAQGLRALRTAASAQGIEAIE